MKRFAILLTLAAAIIGTAACNKATNPTTTQVKRSYTAVIADATRSELAEDGDIYHTKWTAGDRIAITDGEYTSFYKTSEGGTSKATFSFACGKDPEWLPVAFFPSTITKELPTVQKYVPGKIFIPMMGEIIDDNIVFSNICGMMKLNISAEKNINIRRLEISADQPICGEYYVDGKTAIVEDDEGILIVEFDEGLAVSTTAVPVYISMPANKYTGLKFTAYASNRMDYCEVSLKRGKSITIERSTVHEGDIVLKNFKKIADTPAADLFDIYFLPDGTAQDISSMNHSIQTIDDPGMCSYFDARLGRWVAHFNHKGNLTINSGFYRADYDDFVTNALGESHTFECLTCMDIMTEGNTEWKMFSTMQSGGTGFLVSKADAETPMQFTFLPHVGGSYIWAGSDIMPEPGRYYHLVGVYDKNKELVSVYVDGELVGEYDAIGDFKAASAAARWFCVGGDASTTAAMQNGWKGTVAIARAYSTALNEDQVHALYMASHVGHDYSNFFAYTGISFISDFLGSVGDELTIMADGIIEGDYICLEPLTEENHLIECVTTYESGSLYAAIPAGLTTGQYRIWACRDEEKYPLGKAMFTIE